MSYNLHITSYEMPWLVRKLVKKTKEAEDESKDYEKQPKVVMMSCSPEDQGKVTSEELKEVCIKLGKDLGDRGNVVMTRLDDSDLKQIDALVELEAFKSRSEAAAFFIKQGIQARKDLFEKVMPTVEKIRELKEQAQKELGKKDEQHKEVKK